MTTKFLKHVGVDHLGTKLVIVFRELPDDTDSCLVVASNSLSEMYHDQLMRVLESDDAQQTTNLYEVLQRRMFGDGKNMLNALHERGLMRKANVDQIRVSPLPNRFEQLRVVNDAIRGGDAPAKAQTKTTQEIAKAVAQTEAPVMATGDAESKLLQARLLEDDAKRLREEAYALDPKLKKGGRPKTEQKQAQEAAAASIEAMRKTSAEE